MVLAGKHGTSVLSVSVIRGGNTSSDLNDFWRIAEETAAENGNTMDRNEWRVVMHVHLAETKKEAMEQARKNAGRYQREYFENTLGQPAAIDGPPDKIIDSMVERGAWCVGTPDDLIESINRLDEQTGGFGGFMIQSTEWGTREQVLHSYELVARYVMPHFQGSIKSLERSQEWSAAKRPELLAQRDAALAKARQDYADTRPS
jgi:limonene 1,2-monooxygenase